MRQLVALGIDSGAIGYRVRIGRLHRLHRGVYAVGHARLSAYGRWTAAVLAAGPGALLSHRSAAALWGLRAPACARIEVTVPGTGRRGRQGIRLHRTRRLDPSDRRERFGIAVTSVPRTLLDLASLLAPRQLELAVEDAERLRLTGASELETFCRRRTRSPGVGRLAATIGAAPASISATRSELERRFLRLCRDDRISPPEVNQIVEGFEVDALWRAQRLVVELDGYGFHQDKRAFERDRARDAALRLAGYTVVRFTDRRLASDQANVAATVKRLLARG